ncbi:hypothetical protein JG687_00014707 [Phytophthora cactorum]|uniref:Uncharacterized protein n=1 Tax=Phytophthora cactorum TaxID=29920 RepID=A0A8T1TVU0_9STRA|nr:hypothetical protein PC123_g20865 [Phytophthora cactorum]KAG6949685.1 hypothetical protein JG687_00014707 [Phytophthora cactorum]
MRVDDLDSDGVLVNYAEIYLLADYPLYCWQGEQDHYHLAHARVRGHVNGSTGHRIYNDTKTPLEHSPDLAAWARRSRSWVCTIWRKEPSIIGKDEDIAATLELARASTMLLIKVNAAGSASSTHPNGSYTKAVLGTTKEKTSEAESHCFDRRGHVRGDVDDLALPASRI